MKTHISQKLLEMAISYHLTIVKCQRTVTQLFSCFINRGFFSLDLNVSLTVSQSQCSAWIFFFTFDIEAMP